MSFPAVIVPCRAARLMAVIGLLHLAAVQASAQVSYLEGHTEPVYAVAFSPDGNYLITGSFDRTVKLWDLPSRTVARTFGGHTDMVLCVAISSDGQPPANRRDRGRVLVYDVPGQAPLAEIAGLDAPLASLLASGGNVAVATDSAGAVLIIDVDGGAIRHKLPAIEGHAPVLAIAADGSQLIAASPAGLVRAWSTADAQPQAALDTGADVRAMVIDTAAARLTVAGSDGFLRAYTWPPPQPAVFDVESPVRQVTIVGENQALAIATGSHVVIRDRESGAVVRRLETSDAEALSVAASPDGALLAAGTDDGAVHVWNVADGSAAARLETHSGPVTAVRFAPGADQLATASMDGTIRLWRWPPQGGFDTAAANEPPPCMAVSADGLIVALGTGGSTIKILNGTDGSELQSIDAGPSPATCVAALGAGGWVVGSEDGRLRMITPESGGVLAIELPSGALRTVAVAPGGEQIAAGGDDGVIQLCRPADGARLAALEGHAAAVVGLAYIADGRLVSAADQSIRVWKSATGAVEHTIELGNAVTSLAVDPRRAIAAVAVAEGPARLYALDDGHVLAMFDTRAAMVALGADGRHLFAAGAEDPLEVWDIATGHLVERHDLPAAATHVATGAGARVLVAGGDGHLRAVPITSLGLLAGHVGTVRAIEFMPDGGRLASGGDDGGVRLWNLGTGGLIGRLAGPDEQPVGPVRDLAIDPGSGTIAAAGADGLVHVWDVADGQLRRRIDTGAQLQSLAISTGGRRLACGGSDGVLRMFDVAEGVMCERHPAHDGGVTSLAAGPGDTFVSGGASTARVWTGALVGLVRAHEASATSLAAAGSSHLVSTGDDGRIAVWSAADLSAEQMLESVPGAPVLLACDSAGKRIAAAGKTTIAVWNVNEGALVRELHSPAEVSAIALAEEGRALHVADVGGHLTSYAVADGARLWDVAAHDAGATRVAVAGGSTVLVSAGADGTVRRWTLPTTGPRLDLVGHGSHVYAVDFAPDGARIASASADKTVKLWNTADGANSATCSGHAGPVYDVDFSPDGSELASCSVDKTIRIWNASDGKQVREINQEIADKLLSVCYARDGGHLLSSGLAKTWQIHAVDGSPLSTTSGHEDAVYRARYNPGGTRVATLGFAGSLFVWDIESAEPVFQMQLPVDAAYSLAYAPDGRRLAVATVDHRVLMVELPEAAR